MSLKYQKFLLFGDSITEFAFASSRLPNFDEFSLGAALVNTYTRRMDIIQRGFSGYNSRWALKIIPQILEQAGPDIVMATLFFGTNDAALGGSQRVDLPEFKLNMKKMVKILKDRGIRPILVGPALHDKNNWEPRKPEEVAAGFVRSNENNKLYSDAGEKLAKEERIPFVNLYQAFSSERNDSWQSLLSDGIHFTGKGYEVFFNELMKVIEESYPEYSPQNMEYKLPEWREVDEKGSVLDDYLNH
ncbi:LAFE_0F03642g1_1 [Lachancea fermentati]|uniref:LAFE_0F03642g1_1 n=1 Tax=Lachancea fermentati TaxID=4955 RepID=A0A1G4MEF9_LACFM|nr:LAFE_0F03642g1_1 [Lachancea fermentati]